MDGFIDEFSNIKIDIARIVSKYSTQSTYPHEQNDVHIQYSGPLLQNIL